MAGMKQRVKDAVSLYLLRRSRFFDEKSYREAAGISPDTDAAEHYYRGGWRSADPGPDFDQAKYLEANPDVKAADICPLAHWELYGRRQHFPLYRGYAENTYRRYRFERAAMRVLSGILFGKMKKENRRTRILAVCHIYYPEAADEILEYLKSLRGYRWDLAVTIPEGLKAERDEALRQKILAVKRNAVIRAVPNRGMDLLPFIEEIQRRDLDAYDLIVKVHSKRCDPAKGRLAEGMYTRGRDWFVSLHRAVLGPMRVHRNIHRLTHTRTELIAAKHLIRHDTPYKERLTARFLKTQGLELESGYTFAAGGAWMMKARRAQGLREILAGEEDFAEPRPGTFTLESALERYLTGGIPEGMKYGNPVCAFRRMLNRIRFGKDLYDGTYTEPAPQRERTKCAAFAVTETGEKAVAGDYFTALELAGALERRGWKTRMLSRKELGDRWYRIGPEADLLVSMLEDYDPQHIDEGAPGLVTVGWARNWFSRWADRPGTGLYDLLLASSEAACRELEEKTGRKAVCFPIAANAERFREETEGDDKYRCDVCFTGNRFSAREIEQELVPAELPYDIRIYGEGWENVKHFAPFCKGHLPYEEIPKVYRGAKIALDDATASTKAAGSVNSRVFDALAAGCLVLTNNEAGAEETFEGKLPVFRNREELEGLLKQYLEDEGARKAKVEELRAFVLEKHTYEKRSEKLINLIQNSEFRIKDT